MLTRVTCHAALSSVFSAPALRGNCQAQWIRGMAIVCTIVRRASCCEARFRGMDGANATKVCACRLWAGNFYTARGARAFACRTVRLRGYYHGMAGACVTSPGVAWRALLTLTAETGNRYGTSSSSWRKPPGRSQPAAMTCRGNWTAPVKLRA